jgi:hypothetical protein
LPALKAGEIVILRNKIFSSYCQIQMDLEQTWGTGRAQGKMASKSWSYTKKQNSVPRCANLPTPAGHLASETQMNPSPNNVNILVKRVLAIRGLKSNSLTKKKKSGAGGHEKGRRRALTPLPNHLHLA